MATTPRPSAPPPSLPGALVPTPSTPAPAPSTPAPQPLTPAPTLAPTPGPTPLPADTLLPTTTVPPDEGGGVDPLVLYIVLPIVLVLVMVIIIALAVYYYRWRHLKKYDIQTAVEKADKDEEAPPTNGKNKLPRSDSRKSIGKTEILIRTPSREADLYVVRHFYKAEDASQLSLQTGRIVEVLEKLDNGWWRGVTDDREGWFPANFVRKLDASENKSSVCIENEEGAENQGFVPGEDDDDEGEGQGAKVNGIKVMIETETQNTESQKTEAARHKPVRTHPKDQVEVIVLPGNTPALETSPKHRAEKDEEINKDESVEMVIPEETAPLEKTFKRKPHPYEEISDVEEQESDVVQMIIPEERPSIEAILLQRKQHSYEEIRDVEVDVSNSAVGGMVIPEETPPLEVPFKRKPHPYEEIKDVEKTDTVEEMVIPKETPALAKIHLKKPHSYEEIREVEMVAPDDSLATQMVIPKETPPLEKTFHRKPHPYEEIRDVEMVAPGNGMETQMVIPKETPPLEKTFHKKPHSYEELKDVEMVAPDSSVETQMVIPKETLPLEKTFHKKPHSYEEIKDVETLPLKIHRKRHPYEEIKDVTEAQSLKESKASIIRKRQEPKENIAREEKVTHDSMASLHDIDEKMEQRINSLSEPEMEGFINQIFNVEDEEEGAVVHEVDIDLAVRKKEQADRLAAEAKRREAESDKQTWDTVKMQFPPEDSDLQVLSSTDKDAILSVSMSKNQPLVPKRGDSDYEDFDINAPPSYDPTYVKVNRQPAENSMESDECLNYENINYGKVQGHIMNSQEDVMSDEAMTDFSTDSFSPMPPARKKRSRKSEKTYVAMYPFSPTDPNHLALSRNDVLVHLDDAPNGWKKGHNKNSGQEGWFPESYVREGRSPRRASQAPSSDSEDDDDDDDDDEEYEDDAQARGREYVALHAYIGQEAGDLSFTARERIVVLESLSTGWWRGYVDEGRSGWFPGSYVEALVPSTPTSQDSGFVSSAGDLNRKRTSDPAVNSSLPSVSSNRRSNSDVQVLPSFSNSTPDPNKPFWEKKPEVPKRYVAPKLVKIPKKFQDTSSPERRPVRPVPPVPPVRKSSLAASKADAFISELQKQLQVGGDGDRGVSGDSGIERREFKRQEAVDRDSKVLLPQMSQPESESRNGTLTRKRNSIPRPAVPPPEPPPKSPESIARYEGNREDSEETAIVEKEIVDEKTEDVEEEEEFDMSMFSKTYDKDDEGSDAEEPKDSYENQLNEDIKRLEMVIAKHKEEQELEEQRRKEIALAKQRDREELERQEQAKRDLELQEQAREDMLKASVTSDTKSSIPMLSELNSSSSDSTEQEKPARPPVPKHKPPRPMSPPVRSTSLSKSEEVESPEIHTPPAQLLSSADYQSMSFKPGVTPPLKKYTPMSLVEFSDLDESTVDPSDEDTSRAPSLLDINKYILGSTESTPEKKPVSEAVPDASNETHRPVIKPKTRPNRPSQPPKIQTDGPVPPPRSKSLSPNRQTAEQTSTEKGIDVVEPQESQLVSSANVKSHSSAKPAVAQRPTSPLKTTAEPRKAPPRRQSSSSPGRTTSPPPRPTSPPVLPKPRLQSSDSGTSQTQADRPPQRISSFESIAIEAMGGETVKPDSELGKAAKPRAARKPLHVYDMVPDLKPRGTQFSPQKDQDMELSFTSTYEPPDFTFVSEEPLRDAEDEQETNIDEVEDKEKEEEEVNVKSLDHSHDEVKLEEIDLMSDFMSEFEKRFSVSGNEPQSVDVEGKTEEKDVFEIANKEVEEAMDNEPEPKDMNEPRQYTYPRHTSGPFSASYNMPDEEEKVEIEDHVLAMESSVESSAPNVHPDRHFEDDLKLDSYEPLSRIVEDLNEVPDEKSVRNIEEKKVIEVESEVISEVPQLPDSMPPPLPSCPPPMDDESENVDELHKEDYKLRVDSETDQLNTDDQEVEPIEHIKETSEHSSERTEHHIPLSIISPKPFVPRAEEHRPEPELATDSTTSANPVIAPSASLQKYMIPGARRHSLEQPDERKHYRPVTNRFSALATAKFPWKQQYKGNVKAPETSRKTEDQKEERGEEIQESVVKIDAPLVQSQPASQEDDPRENIMSSANIPATLMPSTKDPANIVSRENEPDSIMSPRKEPENMPSTTTPIESDNMTSPSKESETITSSPPYFSPPTVSTSSPSADQSPLRFFTPTAFVAKKPASETSPLVMEGSEGNNNEVQKHNVLIKRPSFGAETDAESPGAHGYRRTVNTQQWAYTPIGYTQHRSPSTDAPAPQEGEERISDV